MVFPVPRCETFCNILPLHRHAMMVSWFNLLGVTILFSHVQHISIWFVISKFESFQSECRPRSWHNRSMSWSPIMSLAELAKFLYPRCSMYVVFLYIYPSKWPKYREMLHTWSIRVCFIPWYSSVSQHLLSICDSLSFLRSRHASARALGISKVASHCHLEKSLQLATNTQSTYGKRWFSKQTANLPDGMILKIS